MKKTVVYFSVAFLITSEIAYSQFQLFSSAFQNSCTCYTLTPDSFGQLGAVWTTNQIDLSNSFDYSFQVFLGCDDNGADGIAFILQTTNNTWGISGGGLGYQGLTPSIGVLIDTYQSTSFNDPPYDHISLSSNGEIVHGNPNELVPYIQASATSPDIEDCQWHALRIIWNASTQNMQVFFDGVLRLSYTGNIVANIFGGNPLVYWGFTGATGGAKNLQQFCTTLTSSFSASVTTICQGDSIPFSDSSYSTLNNISSWQWNFGDGAPASSVQNPSHIFSSSGTFSVQLTVTDSSGCTSADSLLITVNPNPAPVINTTGPFCFTDSSVVLSAIPAGGTWAGAGVSGNNFLPSVAGAGVDTVIYSFTDANGCKGADTALLFVSPLLTSALTILPDTVICTGGSVTLSAAASGGTSPYSFIWNNGWTGSGPNTEFPLSPTCYVATVTDANGCKDTTQVICISIHPPISVSSLSSQTICEGKTITIGAAATGGNGSPVIITWNGSMVNDTIIVSPLTYPFPATYTAVASDGCSLNDTAIVTISFYTTPVVTFTSDTEGCVPFTVNFVNTTPSVISCQWDFGDSTTSSSCSPAHQFQSVGSYAVSLMVMSTDTCPGDTTLADYITVYPIPPAETSNDTSVYQESTITLAATGGLEYLWNNGEITPEITVSPTQTTTYFVTVTDANGCASYGDVKVTLDFKYVIFVPTMFSPNNDGNNDVLFVRGLGITSFIFQVYDRWGEKVFETSDKTLGWDGKYRGNELNSGVFVYFLNANMENGKTAEQKGNITIVR